MAKTKQPARTQLPENIRKGYGHFSIDDGLLTLWDNADDGRFELRFTPEQLKVIRGHMRTQRIRNK
jgi:hypothetical protein